MRVRFGGWPTWVGTLGLVLATVAAVTGSVAVLAAGVALVAVAHVRMMRLLAEALATVARQAQQAAEIRAALDTTSAAVRGDAPWTCGHCGQRNSGWALDCGRCERRRSPSVDEAIAARERTRQRLEGR